MKSLGLFNSPSWALQTAHFASAQEVWGMDVCVRSWNRPIMMSDILSLFFLTFIFQQILQWVNAHTSVQSPGKHERGKTLENTDYLDVSDFEVELSFIKYNLHHKFDTVFMESPAAIYTTWYIGLSSSTKQIIVLSKHLRPVMHLWPTLWLKPPTVVPLSSNQAISWERQFDKVEMLLRNINSNYTAKLTGVTLYNASCNLDLLGSQVVFHRFEAEGLQTESGFKKEALPADHVFMTSSHQCW